jgi:nitroreductase
VTGRGEAVLAAIRTRRVVRAMSDEPVAREALETVLDAGRWAPTAGNRHLQRFVATDDPTTLGVLRMVSPGMVQRPTAAITICTDRRRAAEYGFPPDAPGLHIDVGTAAATVLLARTRSAWAPAPSPRSAGQPWAWCCSYRRAGSPNSSSASAIPHRALPRRCTVGPG